jgi:hypothetical protein
MKACFPGMGLTGRDKAAWVSRVLIVRLFFFSWGGSGE